jgi:hypothetical protein
LRFFRRYQRYVRRKRRKAYVGKEGVEPSRLSAHDPKSCLSAISNTSPAGAIIAKQGTENPKGNAMLSGVPV